MLLSQGTEKDSFIERNGSSNRAEVKNFLSPTDKPGICPPVLGLCIAFKHI